jgi:hypothetical protein
MNARAAGRLWLLLAAALAAGCSPEADCRNGIKQVRPRVDGAVGSGAQGEARDEITQAYVDLGQAEELAASGDFAGCLARLESARVLLNKSQRTHQQ